MIDSPLISRLIALALEEDCARDDVTSRLCIPDSHQSKGEFLIKESMVVCGLPLLAKVYSEYRADIKLELLAIDGQQLEKGVVAARIQGNTRHILATERTCLNFLQHLSGIATQTKRIVSMAPQLKILDTRKTTPGLRTLQKYAVTVGGGTNHRLNLSDRILIKNNHIDASGSKLDALLLKVFREKPANIPVEVEVRDMDELKMTLPFSPDFIMLDNMDDRQVAECAALIRSQAPKTQIEVSGGITSERLKTLAQVGIDCVSMGMLTNKTESMDISLRVISL